MLGDDPGMADMVADLYTVRIDDIQVGAIRYAREAFQKYRIQPVSIVPNWYAFPGQQRERLPEHPRQFFTLSVDAVFPGGFNGLVRDQRLFARRKLPPSLAKTVIRRKFFRSAGSRSACCTDFRACTRTPGCRFAHCPCRIWTRRPPQPPPGTLGKFLSGAHAEVVV